MTRKRNIFETVAVQKVKRNKFDLSHERKLTMDMGKLVPILLQEIIPGDKFKVKTEILVRLAPMLAPMMHRVDVYSHFFFVPNRLVWNEWEDFITGGEQGDLTPTFPTITISEGLKSNYFKGTVSDYFGIPIPPATTITSTTNVNILPFRAYQLIYNEYFRDQNLETAVQFTKNSGVVNNPTDVAALALLRDRAWEKDYFTSALPWAARGGSATIPIGDVTYTPHSQVYNESDNLPSDGALNTVSGTMQTTGDGAVRVENIDSIEASSITELRKAFKVQEWLEKSARTGSRYIEQILSHFGVKSSDSRLQRPEYLGGGKNPIIISEVLNQAGDLDAGTNLQPVGDMAGHGIGVGGNHGFSRSFEEHGFVIGIMSVLPKTAYQNGIHRQWIKADKFDYYWPEFAHIGEQEIPNREVYYDYVSTGNTETWGYQQRYSDLKFTNDSVHGEFRDSMDYWHMGREFNALPPLNADFVKSDPTKRIFAVTTENVNQLYVQVYNNISALRPIPYHSIPHM